MSRNARLTLRSNNHLLESVTIRKPVKDCYCYSEICKTQDTAKRSQLKPTSLCNRRRHPCDHQIENQVEDANTQKDGLTSYLSCDTIRDIRSIVYSPKSTFLRSKSRQIRPSLKVCSTDTFTPDYSITTKTTTKKTSPRASTCTSKPSSKLTCKCFSKSSSSAPKSLSQTSCNMSRKKTVPSRKSTNVACCLCRKFSCFGSCKLKNYKPIIPKLTKTVGTCLSCKSFSIESKSDDDIQGVCNFREQNYFETHGSNHSLSSSESGSLVQYILNERLFPQPAEKIHHNDLVVTVSPCVTNQKKRLHYFPRYVVTQNSPKQGKCSGCPLTGHDINIGVLRKKHLPNSLALKFQKCVS